MVPKLQARSFAEFTEKMKSYNSFQREDSKFHGLGVMKEIISLTLASITEFRAKGEGAPQLLSNKAIAVSRGWRNNSKSWEALSVDENVYNGWLDMTIKDVYAKLGTQESHEIAIGFLTLLIEHVFAKSNPSGLEIVNNTETSTGDEYDENSDSDSEGTIDIIDDSDANLSDNDDSMALSIHDGHSVHSIENDDDLQLQAEDNVNLNIN